YFVVPSNLDKCRSERRKPVHPEVLRLLTAIRFGEKILPWKHDFHKFDQIGSDCRYGVMSGIEKQDAVS
ncbi:MAG: hypothetical protein FWC43_12295, partial [Planctomycetaceae bacterium]|nr:hypothetical protein [Planctomycetaceae bacterium]